MAESVHSFQAGEVTVSAVKTKATGLTVLHAATPGPLVNLYATLATEAHDDDGCPHTLEHLIFLGSELYPYKGVLDSAANRCLAQGTNAWTDTDHTAYTLTTAGKDGFLNLLPVYLDHILFPTITDTGFLTEVHHVTPEGEDAGVVYCEMQGRENDASSVMERALLHTIWPGDCGFKYETGGIMSNLRDLTVETVRQYHRDFYRPDNLCLIVTGQVGVEEILEAIRPVEERILAKGTFQPGTRPWQTPVPAFTETSVQTVPFASDSETHGHVRLSWRGPEYGDHLTEAALNTLWRYMTESAVSPFRAEFVDCDDPSSSRVYPGWISNSHSVQYVHFSGAPTEKIPTIEKRAFDILKSIAKDGVDMERMATIIHREKLAHLQALETQPQEAFLNAAILHFLYGPLDDVKALEDACAVVERLDTLANKPADYWTGLLESLLEQPYVCINLIPSSKTAQELADNEKARVAAQVERLGADKLAQLGEELEDAMDKNDAEVPTDILASFPVPSTSGIQFVPVSTARATPDAEYHGALAEDLRASISRDSLASSKLPIQIDTIPSAFVTVSLVINTENLTSDQRLFLHIFNNSFFETGVVRDGKELNHEEAIRLLDTDTILKRSSLGFGPDFRQAVRIKLQGEVGKMDVILSWLRDLIWHPIITKERLEITVKKLLNGLEQEKRNGRAIGMQTIESHTFDGARTNAVASQSLAQASFLKALLARINETGLDDYNAFRKQLLQPSNLLVHILGDHRKIGDPVPAVNAHFLPANIVESISSVTCPKIAQASTLLAHADVTGKGYMVGMGAIESSFLFQNSPAMTTFDHKDLPALLTVTEYLTTMEGPFWKGIRGAGLSYGYGITVRPEKGLIYFYLTKSVDPFKAFNEAKRIITGYTSGETAFDPVLAEAARSSVIFSIVEEEETMHDAGLESLLSFVKGVAPTHNRDMLDRVGAVTIEDMQRVLHAYISPLFETEKTVMALTINSSKLADTAESFKGAGRTIETTTVEDLYA